MRRWDVRLWVAGCRFYNNAMEYVRAFMLRGGGKEKGERGLWLGNTLYRFFWCELGEGVGGAPRF